MPKKVLRRVVLGEGHPWFSIRGSSFDTVQLTKERVPASILLRGNEATVELDFKDLGNWNRVRLVVEVLDEG